MKNGFTLLELSIVLVIIGLIIGGITAGADLIRGAELNSVISDVNKYKVAINTFKLKYNALPGDMNNATAYWPTQTLNGNNDQSIANTATEDRYLWEHLSLSGIINGNYSRLVTTDILNGGVGTSKITNAGYSIETAGGTTNSIKFGSPAVAGWERILGAAIDSAEASKIDTKLDDGLAGTGKVTGLNGSGVTGCLSGGNYDLSNSEIKCAMQFELD